MDNDFTSFSQKLKKAFEINSLKIPSDDEVLKFYKFADTLIETNKLFNLSAIKDEDGIIYKHFADCAVITQYIPKGAHLLDVGAGAGFPSIPVAILRPDVTVTALDSTNKRIGFIESTAELCALDNVNTVCGRAEELAGAKSPLRESCDCVTARAVAPLPILCELCIPFIKKGGYFVAMRSGAEDVDSAINAVKHLGCDDIKVHRSELVCENETFSRCTVVCKKIKPTPVKYPRRYSAMVKEPL